MASFSTVADKKYPIGGLSRVLVSCPLHVAVEERQSDLIQPGTWWYIASTSRRCGPVSSALRNSDAN